MKKFFVDSRYCPQNHPCPTVNRCPSGAIKQENFHSAPVIDQEKCTSCGICTRTCMAFKCEGC